MRAEKIIFPRSVTSMGQLDEFVGVCFFSDSLCSEVFQMTHEHRGAQRYDGHDQIQIGVAIYVRSKALIPPA